MSLKDLGIIIPDFNFLIDDQIEEMKSDNSDDEYGDIGGPEAA